MDASVSVVDNLFENFSGFDILDGDLCPDFDFYEDLSRSVDCTTSEDSQNSDSTVDFSDLEETFDFLIKANDCEAILDYEASEVFIEETSYTNNSPDPVKEEVIMEPLEESKDKLAINDLSNMAVDKIRAKNMKSNIEETGEECMLFAPKTLQTPLFSELGNMDHTRCDDISEHLVVNKFGDHDYFKPFDLEGSEVDMPGTNNSYIQGEYLTVWEESFGEKIKMVGSHNNPLNVINSQTSPMKSNSNNPVLGSSGPGGMSQVTSYTPKVLGGGIRSGIRKIFKAPPSKKRKAVSILKIRRNESEVGTRSYYTTIGGKKLKGGKSSPTDIAARLKRITGGESQLRRKTAAHQKRKNYQKTVNFLDNECRSGSRQQQVGQFEEEKDKKNQLERDRRGQMARYVQNLRDQIGEEVVWPINLKDRKVSVLAVLDTAREYTIQLEGQVEQLERERREEQQRYQVLTGELLSLQNCYTCFGGDLWNV